MGLGDLKLDDMIVVALVGCLAATTLTMTVLTFRLPNKGAVLKEQGFQVAHGDFCDTLYVSHVRPFRFAIAKYDGTFSCPWPGIKLFVGVSFGAGFDLTSTTFAPLGLTSMRPMLRPRWMPRPRSTAAARAVWADLVHPRA